MPTQMLSLTQAKSGDAATSADGTVKPKPQAAAKADPFETLKTELCDTLANDKQDLVNNKATQIYQKDVDESKHHFLKDDELKNEFNRN